MALSPPMRAADQDQTDEQHRQPGDSGRLWRFTEKEHGPKGE
jgi:hypothetical protein